MENENTRKEETRTAALVLLCELEQRGQAGKAGYIAAIRSIAGKTRQDGKAHRLLSAALERANIPQECAEVFKAYYLEGDGRPTPRELMRRFYINPRTVYRQNRKALEALLIPLFGVDGLFLEPLEQEPTSAGNVTP